MNWRWLLLFGLVFGGFTVIFAGLHHCVYRFPCSHLDAKHRGPDVCSEDIGASMNGLPTFSQGPSRDAEKVEAEHAGRHADSEEVAKSPDFGALYFPFWVEP